MTINYQSINIINVDSSNYRNGYATFQQINLAVMLEANFALYLDASLYSRFHDAGLVHHLAMSRALYLNGIVLAGVRSELNRNLRSINSVHASPRVSATVIRLIRSNERKRTLAEVARDNAKRNAASNRAHLHLGNGLTIRD